MAAINFAECCGMLHHDFSDDSLTREAVIVTSRKKVSYCEQSVLPVKISVAGIEPDPPMRTASTSRVCERLSRLSLVYYLMEKVLSRCLANCQLDSLIDRFC